MSDEPVALPWSRGCFVCGADNPIGLRARSFKLDDRIELAFTPRPEHAGWNGVVHGGIISTVLDEVMTWAAIVTLHRACFAAEFTVRLRHPLPPGTACRAVARAPQQRRRIVDTVAELRGDDGLVYAVAEGRYMAMPSEKLGSTQHDLVTGPDTWPVDGIFGDSAGR